MMQYIFYVTTYQSGGAGQGDKQTEVRTYRQTNIYRVDMETYWNRYHKTIWGLDLVGEESKQISDGKINLLILINSLHQIFYSIAIT